MSLLTSALCLPLQARRNGQTTATKRHQQEQAKECTEISRIPGSDLLQSSTCPPKVMDFLWTLFPFFFLQIKSTKNDKNRWIKSCGTDCGVTWMTPNKWSITDQWIIRRLNQRTNQNINSPTYAGGRRALAIRGRSYRRYTIFRFSSSVFL